MSQIFHIFRKDVRHHWMEILLCQAALVAYCWDEVSHWGEGISYRPKIQSIVIVVLLPLTWGFLVFRVVQSETLVGDRQFWITRPYEWKRLLAEKILFVLVFLSCPLLIAGAALLIKAGFSPWPHMLGLLWMQLVMIELPMLPLMALAAVTRNLAQGLLALLAVVLYMIGMVALDSALTYLGFPSGDLDVLQSIVVMIVCVVAVGLQYTQRKTAQSRIWLAGGAFVAAILMPGNGYYSHGKDSYPLPAAGQIRSFHAEMDPVKLSAPKEPPEKNEDVNFQIPLLTWGLPPDSLGSVRGVRITLEAPDGFRWNTGWRGRYLLLAPGESRWRTDFSMKYAIYERLKSVRLKAHVAVAVAVFHERSFETIRVTTGEFDVPGMGRCRVRERDKSEVLCHSPLVKPAMVVVRVAPATLTCPALDGDQKPENIPYAWEEGSSSRLPDYGINPIESFQFNFYRSARICPGTPLNFSFPEFMEITRSDFEIDNVNLDELREESLLHGLYLELLPHGK
jgi:hypothetical protein